MAETPASAKIPPYHQKMEKMHHWQRPHLLLFLPLVRRQFVKTLPREVCRHQYRVFAHFGNNNCIRLYKFTDFPNPKIRSSITSAFGFRSKCKVHFLKFLWCLDLVATFHQVPIDILERFEVWKNFLFLKTKILLLFKTS